MSSITNAYYNRFSQKTGKIFVLLKQASECITAPEKNFLDKHGIASCSDKPASFACRNVLVFRNTGACRHKILHTEMRLI